MSEETLRWLFIAMGTWLMTISAAVLGLIVSVTRMRAALIIVSKKAAEILHSPDDHLDIDDLLDRFLTSNMDQAHIDDLIAKLGIIERDNMLSPGTRFLAAGLRVALVTGLMPVKPNKIQQ